jgi:alpha-tubulin suppressor-like RCC1 family protein
VLGVGGIGRLRGVAEIAVSSGISSIRRTCARLANGQVRCWGKSVGTLYFGPVYPNVVRLDPTANRSAPLTGVTDLSAGGYHNCAVMVDTRVRCWGDNGAGQLGTTVEGWDHRPRPVPAPEGSTGPLRDVTAVSSGLYDNCARRQNGTVACWGLNYPGPRPVVIAPVGMPDGALTGALQVDVGTNHACAVLADHTAACWGTNTRGQLGNGTRRHGNVPGYVLDPAGTAPLQGVESISAGTDFTCALMTDGSARCWGFNAYGQLGQGDLTLRSLPAPVLAPDGGGPLEGVVQVSAGELSACARTSENLNLCWGANQNGQLGDGTNSQRSLPVVVRR